MIERLRPVIEVMGEIIVCGELGAGNVVRLVTNQIWFINAAAIGEGLVLGKRCGAELIMLWDAIKRSVGDTVDVSPLRRAQSVSTRGTTSHAVHRRPARRVD